MANSGMADTTGSHGLAIATLTPHGIRITSAMTEDANYERIDTLDTRLQAINSAYYTQAMLRTMTKNDKVYALRVNTADAAGIK